MPIVVILYIYSHTERNNPASFKGYLFFIFYYNDKHNSRVLYYPKTDEESESK